MTTSQVLVLLLLLLGRKNLFRVLVTIRAVVRVCDTDVKDTGTPALPEAVSAGIATFGRDPGEGSPVLLGLLLLALLLALQLTLLAGGLMRGTR